MRLSRLADYAVLSMTAAARRGAGATLSATALARETHLPLPTAQKLLQRLAHAGLMQSARGVGGGFRLARAAEDISLADIVEAIEGPIGMTGCAHGECSLNHGCAVKPHWSEVSHAVRGALAAVPLTRLAEPRP